eukprot:15200324-Heterocapsa_arctica.AAC.1
MTALAASLAIGPLHNADIIPEVPPPLSQPPSQRMSIDTVEHNLQHYMPKGLHLELYTTEQNGTVTLGSLTTRELMMIRRFWDFTDAPLEWTIPPWSSHLTNGICKNCCVREYCSMDGVDRQCQNCGQFTL